MNEIHVCCAFLIMIKLVCGQPDGTMNCADLLCSGVLSEATALEALEDSENNFLKFEKGDTLLVMAKNVHSKSEIWGGKVLGSNDFGFFPSSIVKENVQKNSNLNVLVEIKDILQKKSTENKGKGEILNDLHDQKQEGAENTIKNIKFQTEFNSQGLSVNSDNKHDAKNSDDSNDSPGIHNEYTEQPHLTQAESVIPGFVEISTISQQTGEEEHSGITVDRSDSEKDQYDKHVDVVSSNVDNQFSVHAYNEGSDVSVTAHESGKDDIETADKVTEKSSIVDSTEVLETNTKYTNALDASMALVETVSNFFKKGSQSEEKMESNSFEPDEESGFLEVENTDSTNNLEGDQSVTEPSQVTNDVSQPQLKQEDIKLITDNGELNIQHRRDNEEVLPSENEDFQSKTLLNPHLNENAPEPSYVENISFEEETPNSGTNSPPAVDSNQIPPEMKTSSYGSGSTDSNGLEETIKPLKSEDEIVESPNLGTESKMSAVDDVDTKQLLNNENDISTKVTVGPKTSSVGDADNNYLVPSDENESTATDETLINEDRTDGFMSMKRKKASESIQNENEPHQPDETLNESEPDISNPETITTPLTDEERELLKSNRDVIKLHSEHEKATRSTDYLVKTNGKDYSEGYSNYEEFVENLSELPYTDSSSKVRFPDENNKETSVLETTVTKKLHLSGNDDKQFYDNNLSQRSQDGYHETVFTNSDLLKDTDSKNSITVFKSETESHDTLDKSKQTEASSRNQKLSFTKNEKVFISFPPVYSCPVEENDLDKQGIKVVKQKVYLVQQEINTKMHDEVQVANTAYRDALGLRSKLTSIVTELKDFNHEQENSNYKHVNHKAKVLKKRLMELEENLNVWKLNENEITKTLEKGELDWESFLEKLQLELELRKTEEIKLYKAEDEIVNLTVEIEKLGNLIEDEKAQSSARHDKRIPALLLEVESIKNKDVIALQATERETKILMTKIKILEDEVVKYECEREELELIISQTDDFKLSLADLVSDVNEKKRNEESFKDVARQEIVDTLEMISILENEVQRRNDNQQFMYDIQYEAATLKENFEILQARVSNYIVKCNLTFHQNLGKLDQELKEKFENEEKDLNETLVETSSVFEKVTHLIQQLKSKSYSKQLSNNNIIEVQHLKTQIQLLKQNLQDRLSANRYTGNVLSMYYENDVQERILTVEEELEKITDRENEALIDNQELSSITDTIRLVEAKLSFEEHSKTSREAEDIATNTVVSKESEATQHDKDNSIHEQLWHIMKSKMSNENRAKQRFIGHKDEQLQFKEGTFKDVNNLGIPQAECTVVEDKRIQCGMSHAPKALCLANHCCWSPDPNPNIPNCYFTASQLHSKNENIQTKVSSGDHDDVQIDNQEKPEVSSTEDLDVENADENKTGVPSTDSFDENKLKVSERQIAESSGEKESSSISLTESQDAENNLEVKSAVLTENRNATDHVDVEKMTVSSSDNVNEENLGTEIADKKYARTSMEQNTNSEIDEREIMKWDESLGKVEETVQWNEELGGESDVQISEGSTEETALAESIVDEDLSTLPKTEDVSLQSTQDSPQTTDETRPESEISPDDLIPVVEKSQKDNDEAKEISSYEEDEDENSKTVSAETDPMDPAEEGGTMSDQLVGEMATQNANEVFEPMMGSETAVEEVESLGNDKTQDTPFSPSLESDGVIEDNDTELSSLHKVMREETREDKIIDQAEESPVPEQDSHPGVSIVVLVSQLPANLAYALSPLGEWEQRSYLGKMFNVAMELVTVQNLTLTLQEYCDDVSKKINYWISVLPEEYKNGFYGVSWPVIFVSSFIGIFIIWVISWRRSVGKRNRKHIGLTMQTKELSAQLNALMAEKLNSEKNLEDFHVKLEVLSRNFQQVHSTQAQAQQTIVHIKHEVDALRSSIEGKSHELQSLTAELSGIEKENREILHTAQQTDKKFEERSITLSECEASLENTKEDLLENEKQNKVLQKSLLDLQDCLDMKTELEEEANKRLEVWEERAVHMRKQIAMLEEKASDMMQENIATEQEADVLKDCLLQFRAVQEGLEEDEDDKLDSTVVLEKQKERLNDLIEVARVKQSIKQIENEKSRIVFELEAERKSREETEARLSELEAKRENARAMRQKVAKESENEQAKLNVIQDFYAKREVEMQEKLGKEQTNRETTESELSQEGSRTIRLMEQLEMVKKMNEEAKLEFERSEKQRKNEINLYEKKAHDNWLANQQAEAKLEEANREVTQLRYDLGMLERQLRDVEMMGPLPMRPMLPPPGEMFSRRIGSDSGRSSPNRSGPPFRDFSPGRSPKRRSPAGGIQDEMKRSDRHPPSHGPPPEKLEVGDGSAFGVDIRRDIPRRGPSSLHEESIHCAPPPIKDALVPTSGTFPFGTHRRFKDEPTLRYGPPPARDEPFPPPRDGPPRISDGPPPIRLGHRPPPMRYGPPPMRDGPPPMRYGPPPMRDGPPPMRDGPPPMRDGPPPMRDGPPPMRDGSPPVRDGISPVRDRPPGVGDFPPPRSNFPPPPQNGLPMMYDRYLMPFKDEPPLMRGPPTMGDGPPLDPPSMVFSSHPRWTDARSAPNLGPSTSSPYMDRPKLSPRGPSGQAPPMSLHGNLPPEVPRSEHDLHPARRGPP